jgi:DNA-binding MarR family transcriptional regulator
MTHTEAIRLGALRGLRDHAPCSVSDLAARTGLDPQSLHVAVVKLVQDGLAEQLGPASYALTEAGRAFLATVPSDQVEAPRPVRQLGLFGDEG